MKKPTEDNVFTPNIATIGVGGAGANAINNLINMEINSVKFVVANTDVKSLDSSICENKLRLGMNITKGLGAGSKPNVGYKAAEESIAEIKEVLKDVDLLFIIAGMGGGTGTGASQVIAKVAKEMDILTLGFVTTPFDFEGMQRSNYAKEGIDELEKYIDSLVIISNQNLFRVVDETTSMVNAFRIMDGVIHSGVRAIVDLIISNGMVNLDFNDIKTVLKAGGKSMVTAIEVSGRDRVNKITESIMNNPLIDDNINLLYSKNILINITGGPDMTLFEVDKVINGLRSKAYKDSYINFGAIFDESIGDTVRLVIIATGIKSTNQTIGESRSLLEKISNTTNDGLEEGEDHFNEEVTDHTYMGNKRKVDINSYISKHSSQSHQSGDRFDIDNDNSASKAQAFKALPTLDNKTINNSHVSLEDTDHDKKNKEVTNFSSKLKNSKLSKMSQEEPSSSLFQRIEKNISYASDYEVKDEVGTSKNSNPENNRSNISPKLSLSDKDRKTKGLFELPSFLRQKSS